MMNSLLKPTGGSDKIRHGMIFVNPLPNSRRHSQYPRPPRGKGINCCLTYNTGDLALPLGELARRKA